MEQGINAVYESLESLNSESIETNQKLEDIKILLEKILEKLDKKS